MAPSAQREGFLKVIESQPHIGGRFTGLKRVGTAGGDGVFSLVFSATDVQTGRLVAIKIFWSDRAAESYRFKCFCREAELLERLAGTRNVLGFIAPRGELVVPVQAPGGVSLDLHFPYFAVELASTDVGEVIRAGKWNATQKLLAFREMCKAVQRVHRLRVVHRDIKPSNFLVMGSGAVKLSDFGTARMLDGAEPSLQETYFAPPGDLRYASPELLALLHDVDPMIADKADIFALGATLFELFSGAILGVQVFDAAFATDLLRTMNAVSRRDRKRVYLDLVPTLDAGHPLPSMSVYGEIPTCVIELVEGLYRSMAALDYRKRLCDFERIFWKIDTSLLVLRNEEKVRRWQQQKDQYRRNREARLALRRRIN